MPSKKLTKTLFLIFKTLKKGVYMILMSPNLKSDFIHDFVIIHH